MVLKKRDKIGRRFAVLSELGSFAIVSGTFLVAAAKDFRTAGSLVFLTITLMCIGFVLLYSRSKWKSTPPGRAVMYLVGSFALVGIVVCAQIIFKDWPGRDIIRLATYLGVALAIYNVALTVWKYQIMGKAALRTAIESVADVPQED